MAKGARKKTESAKLYVEKEEPVAREKVLLSSLRLNPGNPRIIKGERYLELIESLRSFPEMMALRPLVVDGGGVVYGGNMRFRALLDLGYSEVPADWVRRMDPGMSEESKSEFLIRDNVGYGEWEWKALAGWDAGKLKSWGVEVPGFVGKERKSFADPVSVGVEKKGIEVRLGDVYDIGGHRLMCGAGSDIGDVWELLGGDMECLMVGSSMVGAEKLGRKSFVMEISPGRCKEIIDGMVRSFPDIEVRLVKQGEVYQIPADQVKDLVPGAGPSTWRDKVENMKERQRQEEALRDGYEGSIKLNGDDF